MAMIKIRDVVDELMEYCFGEEEKAILETSINNHIISVKSQFLHYYERACYFGTLDRLKESMLYKIHLHQDLLVKLKDYYKNINKIVDITDYSKVTLNYDQELVSHGKLTNQGESSDKTTASADQSSSSEQSLNATVTNNATGTSQTNELHSISEILQYPQTITKPLNKKKYQLNIKTTSAHDEDVEATTFITDDENDPAKYQNFSKNTTVDQADNTSVNNSSSSSESNTDANSKRNISTTQGYKWDTSKTSVEYLNNEARLKAWRVEIPKLKQRFWRIFYTLFSYEHI